MSKVKTDTKADLQNLIDNKGNWIFVQYLDNLDLMRLFSSCRVPLEFVHKFKDKPNCFKFLSKNVFLSKSIIDVYSDKLNWLHISRYHVLNSYFVREYIDKLYLEVVLNRIKLKETVVSVRDENLYKTICVLVELEPKKNKETI